MSELDDAIRRVMSDEPGGDESLQEMIAASFRGRRRSFTLFAFFKMTGAAAIATIGAVAFFHVESTRALLASATAVILGTIGMAFWWGMYWFHLNRNSEAREIKRLELQIAELARKLGG